MHTTIPIRERLSVTVQTASEFSGISKSRLYEMLKDGALEGCTVRGRRLIKVRSLIRMVDGDKSAPESNRAA
jgi:excisionase family DNA binding protein